MRDFALRRLRSEKDSGLSPTLIEDLVLKYLSGVGSASGRAIADHLCLPLVVLENRYAAMRTRQEISPVSSGMLGDYVYRLTDQGRDRAQRAIRECAYAGPAPVPLEDYVNSVQAQNIRSEKPRRKQLEAAFADILVSPGPVGPTWAGDQCGQRDVHLRPSGKRQNDDCPANYALFRANDFRPARDCRRRPDHQAVRRCLSSAGPVGGRDLAPRRRIRSSLGPHSAADGRGRRRIDDGQPGAEAQRDLERQRSLACNSRATAAAC